MKKEVGIPVPVNCLNVGDCFVHENRRGCVIAVIVGDRTSGSIRATYEDGKGGEHWDDTAQNEVVYLGKGTVVRRSELSVTWPDGIVSKWIT